jgi:hypothetical protein
VATLRPQTNDVARLQAENKELRARTGQDKPKPAAQLIAESHNKLIFQRMWLGMLTQYARTHDGQFPASFDQLGANAPRFRGGNQNITTDQFDLMYTGTTAALTNAANTIVMREKEAWNAGTFPRPPDQLVKIYGLTDQAGVLLGGMVPNQWAKVYGFADGHMEIHQEIENDFSDFEQQHTVPPSANPK